MFVQLVTSMSLSHLIQIYLTLYLLSPKEELGPFLVECTASYCIEQRLNSMKPPGNLTIRSDAEGFKIVQNCVGGFLSQVVV